MAKNNKQVKKEEPSVLMDGIELGNINGIEVDGNPETFTVSFPNRTDIRYQFIEKAIGAKHSKEIYSDESVENKLYEKEKIQRVTITYNKSDLSPEALTNLKNAISNVRELNLEKINERDNAIAYIKAGIADKELKTLGLPYKKDIDEATQKEIIKPGYFNGEVVSAGKHLIAAIEGETKDSVYVRFIESTKLPLSVQEYSDRQNAVRNHLGIKEADLTKANVNGQEVEVVNNVKRHIAFGKDWNISKVNVYEQKQEQEKTQQKTKKNVHTLAQ